MAPISHLQRNIDLSLTSNRWAVGLFGGGALAGWLRAADDGRLTSAMVTAFVAFFAWALGRELDPDETTTALVAGIATIAASLMITPGGAIASLATLLACRILARTTGRPMTLIDVMAVFAIGGYAAFRPGWIAAVGVAVAMVVDQRLSAALDQETPLAVQFWAGAVLGLATAVVAGVTDATWIAPSAWGWTVVALGLAGGLSRIHPGPLDSVGDLTRRTLSPPRIRTARIAAIAIAVVAVLTEGMEGVEATIAVWVSLAATGLVGLANR